MVEPPQLRSVREHLSQAEQRFRTEDGLFHLQEALVLLEDLMDSAVPEHRTIARNLASTYSARIFGVVRRLVATDPGLPEPELEHLFKVALAFDEIGFELPADARSAKIAVVAQLVDRYYEGHTPEEKRAVLEELAKISGRRS